MPRSDAAPRGYRSAGRIQGCHARVEVAASPIQHTALSVDLRWTRREVRGASLDS